MDFSDPRCRWTFIRESSPKVICGKTRKRAFCECICGRREVILLANLQANRTSGCANIWCKARYEVGKERAPAWALESIGRMEEMQAIGLVTASAVEEFRVWCWRRQEAWARECPRIGRIEDVEAEMRGEA